MTTLKPLCRSQQTGKLLKRWDYQITSPASCETCMQVKKQHLKPDMDNGLVTNLENSAVDTGLKRSVFIPISKKGNAKECSDYHTSALISDASKVMLKILQASLQQYMSQELPHVQAGFRKGRRTRDQIVNIRWIMEMQESSRKTSISALLTMRKPLTVWITINCGKF